VHIQVVTFNLNGISDAEYRAVCDQFAPAFAEVPGLISKVWLADPERNEYGGVYTWVDRTAMDSYLTSDLFNAVAGNPAFANIGSRDFAVIDAPTRVTRGLAATAAAA
jgi:hypothetical protein